MSLTQPDLQKIKKLVRLEIDDALEQKLEEKLEQKLEEKLGKYPTKDEFYASMDKLMGKLEKIEQELILTPSHPGGKHLTLQL